MDQTLTDFNRIKEAIRLNVNSPDELSKLGLELASLRATVGEAEADAEDKYATEVVLALTPQPTDEKAVSVAYAERKADSITNCQRERLTHRLESIDELVNMVKVRIRVLGVEQGQTNG